MKVLVQMLSIRHMNACVRLVEVLGQYSVTLR
jgi:hypothetical protein